MSRQLPRTESKKIAFLLRLPKEIAERVRALSEKKRKSYNFILNQIVEKYFREKK